MHTRKLLYSGSLVLNSITIGQRESDNINCMIGIRKSPAHEKCFLYIIWKLGQAGWIWSH
jgi:hypothetical protein